VEDDLIEAESIPVHQLTDCLLGETVRWGDGVC